MGKTVSKAPGFVALSAAMGMMIAAADSSAQAGHGAHVHGVAELALVQSGDDVEIELTSPAADIVGFEHKADAPDELSAVATAEEALKQATNLFSFAGTGCDLQAVTVDMSAILNGGDHADSVHDEHQKPEAHDDHDHDHDHDHHDDDSAHGDVGAQYTFSCDDGSNLQSVRVGSDGLPFGLETINAMWVTDAGQGAAALTSGQQVIQLK
ncbi:MAG: DUF2796 domain-containing protein [Pseudomonadota bacterium]